MNGTFNVNGTSSDENANDQLLAAATITTVQVILVVGFMIITVASISAISCVVVRKRRRSKFNQDESGCRVVRAVWSGELSQLPPPTHTSATQNKSDQAHHVSEMLKTIIVDEVANPQTNPQSHVISCENGKVTESFYAFDLEDSCTDDDEYDDIVYHTRQASYDDVVYPSPPAYNSHYDHLVDMDTLQSKIDTLTQGYHNYADYDDVIVDTDRQCPEWTLILQSNGYESLNTASDSDVFDDGTSLDEECYYNVCPKPPSSTDTLVRVLQHMPITKTIKANEVHLEKLIGRGQFGDVHKGMWKMHHEVAVKVLNKSASRRDHVRFLKECYIMSQFDHANIVRLLGVVSQGHHRASKMMVLELLEKGDLRLFVRNMVCKETSKVVHHGDTASVKHLLLKFTRDIVAGMKYLSCKGFIHRDLAARNILISEGLTAKIGDFGLACDMSDFEVEGKCEKVPLPLRWTSLEVMGRREFSSASDVWSFGVVLFEMWSFGKKPYGGMQNQDMIDYLFSGQRLTPPPGCPKPIYHIMITCWHPRPASRPSFSLLQSVLNRKDDSLLHFVPDNPSLAHPCSHVLGESIDCGVNLYPALQHSYLVPHSYTMPRDRV